MRFVDAGDPDGWTVYDHWMGPFETFFVGMYDGYPYIAVNLGSAPGDPVFLGYNPELGSAITVTGAEPASFLEPVWSPPP
jgi:hypothetical protein